MKQELVESFLAYHAAVPAAFSAAQRVAIALRLLELEHEWAFATPSEPPSIGPTTPTRWFEVTDFGLMSEEVLAAKLGFAGGPEPTDLDDLMVQFAITFGKVVTPLDPAVPPFYLINGQRESIYQLRLRIKALYIDEWNTWSRDDVVARLRANNDAVQAL